MSPGLAIKLLLSGLIACAVVAAASYYLPNEYWAFLEAVPVKRFFVFMSAVVVATGLGVLYFAYVSPHPKRFLVSGFWFVTPLVASGIFVASRWPEKVLVTWDKDEKHATFDFQFQTLNGWTVLLLLILAAFVLIAWAMYAVIHYADQHLAKK
jgi:hypothetical protein